MQSHRLIQRAALLEQHDIYFCTEKIMEQMSVDFGRQFLIDSSLERVVRMSLESGDFSYLIEGYGEEVKESFANSLVHNDFHILLTNFNTFFNLFY